MLPEAKRSVLRSDAIDVIQLSSGILSSELPSGLLWAFGIVHNGFFFETLHRDSELLAKWNEWDKKLNEIKKKKEYSGISKLKMQKLMRLMVPRLLNLSFINFYFQMIIV